MCFLLEQSVPPVMPVVLLLRGVHMRHSQRKYDFIQSLICGKLQHKFCTNRIFEGLVYGNRYDKIRI